MPKLRLDFAKLIIASVLTLAGVFIAISKSTITAHELDATHTYEAIPSHNEDIIRIETSIKDIHGEMKTVTDMIVANQREIMTSIARVSR